MRSGLLTYIFAALFFVVVHGGSPYIRAPCVFRGDEVEMHKYSAVLAATEPFKESCQKHVMNSIGPIKRLSFLLGGGSILKRAASVRDRVDAVDMALSRYEDRVSKALSAYGLEPEEFNEISQLAIKNPSLRRKINLQSYYYKIAADLQSNLNNDLTQLPPIRHPSILSSLSSAFLSQVRKLEERSCSPEVQVLSPVQRFARSIATIEAERLAMRSRLMNELHLKELPERMSDPSLQPAFCTQIRHMSAALPRTALHVITQNGLDPEQFEALQDRVERNPFFRMHVQREIRRLEKQQKHE